MAKNGPKGGGRRGAIKGRTQTKNPRTDRWTKRDTSTGKFLDVKSDGSPFKGVRRER